MNIELKLTNLYGIERIYIVDEDTAKKFRELTNNVCITRRQMEIMKDLFGCTFSIQTPQL